MLKYLVITLCTFSSSYVCAQNIHFNINHKKLRDFIIWEQSLGDMEFKLNGDYVSGDSIAQPVVYRHHEDNMPDMLVYCFYFSSDSTIKRLEYEWDDNNFNTDHTLPKTISLTQANAFIEKYKMLYEQTVKQLGVSESTGNMDDYIKAGNGTFEKEDKWKAVDSIDVDLYMILSNKSETYGNISIKPTHKIRLYIEHASTPLSGLFKPGDAAVNKADSLFHAFLLAIKDKKYDEARKFFPTEYADKVTDEQLSTVSKNLNNDAPMVIYFTGVQMSLTGTQYLMIQYKFANDVNNPPGKLVKVIFDKDDHILGVQPVNRFKN